ncbi:MAG: hypothetical protein EBS37_16180 [Betaproteobacteria bacterium]|nr:hypothetical protein [Betaproteobacteria bacterium]
MLCSSVNLLFLMYVSLQFDGLYKPQLGTASGWQVNSSMMFSIKPTLTYSENEAIDYVIKSLREKETDNR